VLAERRERYSHLLETASLDSARNGGGNSFLDAAPIATAIACLRHDKSMTPRCRTATHCNTLQHTAMCHMTQQSTSLRQALSATASLRHCILMKPCSVRFAGLVAGLKLARLSPVKCHSRMPRKINKKVPGALQKSKLGLPCSSQPRSSGNFCPAIL